MLPKANRLKHKADFARVLESGKKTRGESLIFFVAPPQSDAFRLGVIVSKKVSKKAVSRNTIRRVISAIVRCHLASLPINDLAVLVLRDPGEDRYKVYEQEMLKWLKTLS